RDGVERAENQVQLFIGAERLLVEYADEHDRDREARGVPEDPAGHDDHRGPQDGCRRRHAWSRRQPDAKSNRPAVSHANEGAEKPPATPRPERSHSKRRGIASGAGAPPRWWHVVYAYRYPASPTARATSPSKSPFGYAKCRTGAPSSRSSAS